MRENVDAVMGPKYLSASLGSPTVFARGVIHMGLFNIIRRMTLRGKQSIARSADLSGCRARGPGLTAVGTEATIYRSNFSSPG